MKRGKKLMLLASVLVVFIAAAVIVNAIVTKNEEAATEESAPVTFLTVDPDAVTALKWTYNAETVNLNYQDGVWTDADDAKFPVDRTYPEAMLAALKEVTASRSFAAEDASEYGLDAPTYTIQIDTDTVTTLSIGSASAISGEYYASIGDGQVYLVDTSLADPFSYALPDILLMETIPDMTAPRGMDLSTASGELNMVYLENSDYAYTDAYHWFLLRSGTYSALGSAADTLASDIANLSWLSCVNYDASGEDLLTYGLAEPSAIAILSYERSTDETDTTGTTDTAQAQEATFALEIGGFTDNGYYARIQGSPMVYLIDSELAQSILNASYDNFRPTDVCLLDWDTVSSFDVTLDGTTYTFDRNITATTDADGNVTQEETFLMNGAPVDTGLVNAVFDAIYKMSSTGTTGETPGAAEISFAFRRNTATFGEIDLAFYRLNSASCIVGMGGETRLTVARADVVALIEAVNAILLQ